MGRTAFGNFLKSEFSEENMDFWVACEDYKRSTPSKLATRAKKLYRQHVEADAPHEVMTDLYCMRNILYIHKKYFKEAKRAR